MTKIHIIHENDAWTGPLFAALDARGLDYQPWHLAEGRVEADAIPPEGVFYNRMSASSHTRDHRFAPELTRQVLAWLETHGRRVINDSRAVNLEIDKLAQYRALARAGIETPSTIGAVGRESVLAAAGDFPSWPLILKPNRGGAGAGVQLVDSPAQLAEILDDPATEWPLDGTWLVQDYIRADEPCVTRCEFIDGRFLYAVRVDTSDGFELCPADACALPTGRERFEIIEGFDDPILQRYERFLAANGIEVAGIEFVRTPDGRAITYDVNTNTNYNAKAEQAVGVSGMGQLADFLGRALDEVRHRKAA